MLLSKEHALGLLAVLLVCVSPVFAAKKSGRSRSAYLYSVDVRQVQLPPTIDGALSKGEWQRAAMVNRFTQKEPVEGADVSEPTFVLITYDESNIYFGIRCFDKEPDKIVGNEMRRDYDLSENDYFEIIIDTFHDQRNAYYFATNSLGARLDCEIKTEGEHINWDWDGIWRSAAQKDRYGWTAEVAIPFQTLRFENADQLTWGINFGRYIPRKREESFWSPISRDDDYNNFGRFRVSKFGTLNGLKNLSQDQRFQIAPFVVGGVERQFGPEGGTLRESDIGLDAKIRLTSNLVSDVTINTDFAQVEADEEEVNLSRFSLFFPEKRSFFIEGLDVFNVGEESRSGPFSLLFFSRRIGLVRDPNTFALRRVPITGGVKATGKEGKYEIGFLNVLTGSSDVAGSIPGAQRANPRTNYSALRVKRDLFERSHVGFIGLSKDATDGSHSNRTFAVDGSFAFQNNIEVDGYLAKTFTPGIHGGDYNAFLRGSWGNDKYFAQASFSDIGRNFNPEMGFLLWQDVRKYNLQMSASPRHTFLNSRQVHLSYDIEHIADHNNELQYRTLQPGLLNIFKDESYFFLGWTNYYDNIQSIFSLGPAVIRPGVYRYNVVGASYVSDLSKKVAGSVRMGGGSFYDGTFLGLTLNSYFRPADKVAVDLTWNWNRVDVPFENGEFTTNIVGFRFNYSFSTELYVKTFIQWNSFDNRIVSNILLNYIHSPGSNFYLVYNEELNTLGGVRTSNRTLLAKLTYLLNL